MLQEAGDVLLEWFSHIGSMQIMEAALIQLFVIFLIARIFSEIFVRFGMLSQVGEIIAGILIANLFIGDFSLAIGLDIAWDLNNPSVYHEVLVVIANLGVIFLLFVVGMETRMADLRAVGRPAMWVAVLGTIIPFALGFGLVFGYENFIVPREGWLTHALFMAAAMVATCVGITARVLTELGVMATIESRIIIGAAVIDDILAMIVLAVVIAVSDSVLQGGTIHPENILFTIAIALVFVASVMMICVKIPQIRDKRECKLRGTGHQCLDRSWPLKADPFPLAVLTCLGLSALAMSIGLAAIIGAFLAGMLFSEFAHEEMMAKFQSINAFLVPFFFVYVGMRVEIAGLGAILPLAIGTIILAIVGKYVGGYIGVITTQKKKDKESANIVGIGMAPRGEVGVIVAAIGLSAGAITRDLYTVVVLMSIITALIAPPWLAHAFKKKYGDSLSEADRV